MLFNKVLFRTSITVFCAARPCSTLLFVQPFSKTHFRQTISNKGNLQQRFMTMSSNDEQAKAQNAGPEEVTIFDKIVAGDIPCKELYSDDKCMAFHDINPQAPVHFVVIPKKRDGLSQLIKARPDQKELLGHLLYVAKELAAKECPNGYRITINDSKDGGQSVYHLHLHVMGGRPMKWPPG